MKQLSLLLSIVALLISCAKIDKVPLAVENPKPNIIYILADDLGYGDLSFTGQTKFMTPNIDKLAEEGMFFNQHYSGSTVCAPSRSSLMTGQHTGHTFIRGNKEIQPEGQYPLQKSAITIPKLLKSAGYVTGAYGKWGLGYPSSEGDPVYQGFDEFYGYNCQRIGHKYYPTHMWHNLDKENFEENFGDKKQVYGPEKIHEKAISFIEKNKDTTFFLYYPSIIPHAELVVPEDNLKQFRGKFPPEKPYVGKDDEASYKDGTYGSQKEPHAAFAAMVSLLDKQVGEIRAKVKELGIADRTIIIFTSDNGPHIEGGADPDYFNSNNGFRGYKRDLYEGGIRVPMIAFWPGKIKANTTSDHISAFWDVLPTVCDISDIEVPQDIDGISFLPEMLGEKQQKHAYLYWEFQEQGGKQAVRMDNWKGVRLQMTDNPNTPLELYDLSKDAGEENNLASDYPKIIAEITEIMNKEHMYSPEFSFNFESDSIR